MIQLVVVEVWLGRCGLDGISIGKGVAWHAVLRAGAGAVATATTTEGVDGEDFGVGEVGGSWGVDGVCSVKFFFLTDFSFNSEIKKKEGKMA